MKLQDEALRETMLGKTDDELAEIVYVHSRDYAPQAIEIAREEFNRRQLIAPTQNAISAAVEKVREKEDAGLSWPLRIVAFFVTTGFFFIPLLLAHQHYVGNGQKRKASDWLKWALFGFAFYCVLGFISAIAS